MTGGNGRLSGIASARVGAAPVEDGASVGDAWHGEWIPVDSLSRLVVCRFGVSAIIRRCW